MPATRRCARLLALSIGALLAAPVAAEPTRSYVADFDGRALGLWRVNRGEQFPGAAGSLSSAPGRRGRGLRLAYDFRGGGRWVAAELTPTEPLEAAWLSFWVKAPPGIRIAVQAVDDGGQLLQYHAPRPLNARDPRGWYRLSIDLTSAHGHWGGANDGAVHGGVRRLRILAADPMEPTTAGTLDIDDVELDERVPVVKLDPWRDPLIPAPSHGRQLTAGWGVNIHFTHDDRALDAAVAAGLKIVRMDLFWQLVERTPGQYDFGEYDELVRALESRHMSAILILDYDNPLHADGPGWAPQSRASIAAFAAFAAAAARHYRDRPVTFEIWNEPNTAFWKPAPDARQYASAASEAIRRVHAASPATLVSTGGLSTFDFPYLRRLLAANGARGANAVAIHPYRNRGSWYVAPETVFDELLLMQQIVRELLPAPLPIWDTEWGFSSAWFHEPAARTQAIMTTRELLAARMSGLPIAIYYDLRDDGTDPENDEHHFGLLDRDYAPKPAYEALRTLQRLTADRRMAGSFDTEASSLRALRLDGDSDLMLIVWCDVPGQTIRLSLPPDADRIVDLLGASQPTVRDGERLVVTVDDAPLYVFFRTPQPL